MQTHLHQAIREQDLRFRTHDAALSRFYLDALLGLVPIRTHGAARAFRNEYESLLVNWIHACFALARVRVLIIGMGTLVNTGLTVWILFDYVGGETSGVLVLLYWILSNLNRPTPQSNFHHPLFLLIPARVPVVALRLFCASSSVSAVFRVRFLVW